MNTPSFFKPLWVIIFDHSIKSQTIKDKALFYVPNKKTQSQISLENKRLALDFLEKMNDSFKEITEAFLTEAEKDKNKKPQVNEIREKFKSLDTWIKWLRNWQKPSSEDS